MTEKTRELQGYGTRTDGQATTKPDIEEGNEAAENPVGFDAEADRAEETSVETTDEGQRSSVEDI